MHNEDHYFLCIAYNWLSNIIGGLGIGLICIGITLVWLTEIISDLFRVAGLFLFFCGIFFIGLSGRLTIEAARHHKKS